MCSGVAGKGPGRTGPRRQRWHMGTYDPGPGPMCLRLCGGQLAIAGLEMRLRPSRNGTLRSLNARRYGSKLMVGVGLITDLPLFRISRSTYT